MASFIDGHVHIHTCYPLDKFLDSAITNFRHASMELDQTGDSGAIMLLTESAGDDCFAALGDSGSRLCQSAGQWRFEPTDETQSITAENTQGHRIVLIAGRQIVTAENLEILWIGTAQRISDGLPIQQLIDQIDASEGIAVLPWGPGKWYGRRGKIVKETITTYKGQNLFLGDNGNRPFFWPTPTNFRYARDKGIRILPGSDPLPLATEAGRAGTFGFYIDENVSALKPCADLLKIIRNQGKHFRSFGRLESPGRFFRNQFCMQLIKKGLMKR
jgi:hypothetical protein